MKREKLFYGTAIAVLVAALILGLWYKQPKTIREITGVAEPETVTVIIQQRNVMLADIDLRKLTLSAGDSPSLTLRLKPGADVLESATELVEDLRLATEEHAGT